MKKFLLGIGILFGIFVGFVVYDNFKVVEERLVVEEDRVRVDKLYVYGTHLNIYGNYNGNDEAELVLYDGEFISYDLNYYDDGSNDDETSGRLLNFNVSDKVNEGIYLDEIDFGEYYLFLRVKYVDDEEEKYRYYAIDNESSYEETVYYSMSNYDKKIIIDSEDSYPTMRMRVIENKDDEIYDIVLDPGHGGRDGGATKYGYKETDFTMDIALKVKEKLEEYGFNVKLTHNKGQIKKDEKLAEYGVHGRAVVSSEVKAKYLFSFHLNSSDYASVNGLEVYTANGINYDLARLLVKNITSMSGVGYSSNKINKIENGIYSRSFTDDDIKKSINEYEEKELIPYDITTDSSYYYIIRETGGIVTGAYVDGRNPKITANPYTKSNVGCEAYLLELGYLSNKSDLDKMVNRMDDYVSGIALSIKSLYDDGSSKMDGNKKIDRDS